MATSKDTSLLAQTEDIKKKYGGDPYKYDIKGAIKNYDANLAKYNDVATSQQDKDAINAQYGGDITKWNNDTAYGDYQADLKYYDYVGNLNNSYNAMVDSARNAESEKMQYADTRRQLMQKYLPETLMAQGVANTGYTADALLKAENNYNQYVLGAMNDRAATEQDAMQSYRDALGQFKQEQSEEAYQRFLQSEEDKKAKESEQAGLFSTVDTMVEEGYITSLKDALAKLKAYGADDATMQKFSDYWEARLPSAEETAEIETKKVAGDDATGNIATFTYNDRDGYSGSLVATSANGDDVLRVDPNFGDFDFDKDGDEGNVEFDGTKYKIAVSSVQNRSFLEKAKEILGDNYNKPHAMFMYNGEIYMVSDKKYGSGEYKIYLMKGTGKLKDAIVNSVG